MSATTMACPEAPQITTFGRHELQRRLRFRSLATVPSLDGLVAWWLPVRCGFYHLRDRIKRSVPEALDSHDSVCVVSYEVSSAVGRRLRGIVRGRGEGGVSAGRSVGSSSSRAMSCARRSLMIVEVRQPWGGRRYRGRSVIHWPSRPCWFAAGFRCRQLELERGGKGGEGWGGVGDLIEQDDVVDTHTVESEGGGGGEGGGGVKRAVLPPLVAENNVKDSAAGGGGEGGGASVSSRVPFG